MTADAMPGPRAGQFMTWVLFLLPALALTTGPGIGMVEVALLAGALCWMRRLWQGGASLYGDARPVAMAFVFHLLAAMLSLSWSGFEASALDNVSRQALAVLAIALIVLARPRTGWFWHGLAVGTLGAAAIALYQRIVLDMPRAESFHQAIVFGDIAIAMGLMALASIDRFAGTRLAAMPYVAFLAGTTASVLSGSRGGWVALVFAFLPLYSFGDRPMRRRIVALAAASAVLVTAAWFVPETNVRNRIVDAKTDIVRYFGEDLVFSPVGTRLEMWKGAWMLFSEHPVAGVGRTQFNAGLNGLIARGAIGPDVASFHHAHNEMLHALATEGMIGGLALAFVYGAPLAFFIRRARRRDAARPYAMAGMLLVLSYIDFGLSQVLFAHHVGALFYALTTCVLAGCCLLHQGRDHETPETVHAR